MKMTTKIKVGMIYCGSISEFRHASECRANQNSEIAGSYDPQLERADKLVKNRGGTAARDFAEITQNHAIDAISDYATNKMHRGILPSRKGLVGKKPGHNMASAHREGKLMEWTSHDIAKMIDHSLLRPELTTDDIGKGCEISKRFDVAAVCCAPSDVALVKGFLQGSAVKIAAVVGFPHGYNLTTTKVFEAEQAIRDGAQELDMVLHIGRLRSRDFDYVKADVAAVVKAAHRQKVIVKVILENCYLTDELKETACRLCEEAGADFVKTSTGFAKGGATLEDLRLMRQSVSARVQVKAAGGVRDLAMALKVREAGATRFGATQTEGIMQEAQRAAGAGSATARVSSK
jgi:deoxyribose-phosphate aldolase